MSNASPLDLFAQLPKAAFDFLPFPIVKCSVKGGLRYHTHEYPKAAGGSPEKLGRKLYEITMHAIFDSALLPPWNQNGADLWRATLPDLFDRFDAGLTSTLTIPTVGNIQAFCTNWTREMSVKVRRSGEECELVFLEDQSAAYLITNLIQVRAGDLSVQGSLLAQAYAISPYAATVVLAPGQPSLFDQIVSAINTAMSFLNDAAAVSSLAISAVNAVLDAFSLLDGVLGVPIFDDASNAALLEATLEAWAAAQRLQQDLLQRQAVPLINYVTRGTMSVTDVAVDLYSDPDRAAEIMQLNALDDPLAIPAATQLAVYAPVASDQSPSG